MTVHKFQRSIKSVLVPVVLGLSIQACSDSDDSSTETEATMPQDLISSWTLEDAGFDGLVPLLEPRASITVPDDIEDSALSPDGSLIAFALAEENSTTQMNNTLVHVYSTSSGELIRTLRADEALERNPDPTVVWSDNSTLHAIHTRNREPNIGQHWFTWDTTDGSLLQSQTIAPGDGCGDFRNSVTHSDTNVLLYTQTLDSQTDGAQSHLCRLDLANYDRTAVALDFTIPAVVYQVISTDGTQTLVHEEPTEQFVVFESTRVFDTTTLQESREPYPTSHGQIELLAPDYSVVDRNFDYQFLPGGMRFDSSGGRFSASQSGNVMVLLTPSFSNDAGDDLTGASDHIRFIALPSGVVIGDAPETDDFFFNTHRHFASDGSVATVENNGVIDVYDLTGRSQVSSFPPL